MSRIQAGEPREAGMSHHLRRCTRCVMDTTDPRIQFDDNGVCNHCHRYDLAAAPFHDADRNRLKLAQIVEKIRQDGRRRSYDCIAGISGGVDSTFTLLRLKELGLRPLAIHFDNGWNSELAVDNIRSALQVLDIDLLTHVVDWVEMRDIQRAFLFASTPDLEIPTDHAIIALLFRTAIKHRIPYVITGVNYRTESHLPRAWSQGHRDWKYIESINRRFGHTSLRTFPHLGIREYYLSLAAVAQIDILNYMDYSKKDALKILKEKLGWRYYGGKHYESIYTRFCQGCILPEKFGYDKRKTHLSSLICSGEITRRDALKELQEDTYPKSLQEEDRGYVMKKLGLSGSEFDAIMTAPIRRYEDYPNHGKIFPGGLFQSFRLLRAITQSVSGRYALIKN